MRTRREFIRNASIGTVAVSSLYGFSAFANGKPVPFSGPGKDEVPVHSEVLGSDFPGWEISFDEESASLSLKNGPVSLSGRLQFTSGTDLWTIVPSRDGIKTRYAFVDLKGNVQGYMIFQVHPETTSICFFHRTAQNFKGRLVYSGTVNFFPGSFPCRTRAGKGERVLPLSCGSTDSLLNDSLFDPANDILLKLDASDMQLIQEAGGSCSFKMSGNIEESAEAAFTVVLQKNYFKTRYVPYYHPLNRERCPKTPTGWMSWNTYFDKATADDNLDEARIGQKYLQPFGCEFWSIESWQENSDHLPVSDFHNMDLETSRKKFPRGMKRLAEDIRKLGFRPGLWMAPFGTGNREFYETHKSWFLHDETGKPVSSWNGRFTLDPTVPEALDHLRKIFRTASREWGYQFFKIDGMSGRSHGYCAHLYERPEIRKQFKDPYCPNPFELCVKTFREGIGEDRVFLACQGHSSGPEALYADASRLGADIVHPNEPARWNNVYNQGRCTLNQIFTHNIVMIADPDTLLVHDLPLEEARVSATVVALPGQLTFFGDKLAGLTGDQMKILQQTLPVAPVRPVNLYPYFSMLPVWNLQVESKLLGDYNVVALFNWKDEEDTISFTTSELGKPSGGKYVMYEFWTQKSHGITGDSFSTAVPAHSVRLFSMHTLKTIPQWVSSDRHIAQFACELKEYGWISAENRLEGKIELIGTFPLTMRLHVPPGFTLSEAACKGAQCLVREEEDSILAVTFRSEKTGDFNFTIIF